MPIDLYYLEGSAPCRSVRLVAAALGLELNLKMTNLMTGDHMKPEFLKMNPQHTIPTLDDNGFYLWESRAIMTYLVNKYGKDDSLYPKDAKKRALVDQRLYFDLGVVYQAFAECYYTYIFQGVKPTQEKLDKVNKGLGFLNTFLEGEKYVAGNTRTLADIGLAVTISNYMVMNYDFKQFPNIPKWYARIEAETPKFKEIEGSGMKAFKDFVDSVKQ